MSGKARIWPRRAAPSTGPARTAAPLADTRFRRLIPAEAWAALPPAVQLRFSHRLGPGASTSYRGHILSCRMTRIGWLLAQACRLIGAPLPLGCESGLAAIVTVTEHGPSGGQVWTRLYAREGGFPQVIHSAKRFSGPTGLEEYLGCGFGIALKLEATPEGIAFLSDHYFLELRSRGGRALRLRLPRWLGPGDLRIDHADLGGGAFHFILALRHPWLGELIHQLGHFSDQPEIGGGS
jgi:hypothetical protein